MYGAQSEGRIRTKRRRSARAEGTLRARTYFARGDKDRRLFSHLYRAAWDTWAEYVEAIIPGAKPGAVMALHSSGSLLIDEQTIESMKSWEHSGFNFFAGEPIGTDDKDARLFLARYLKKTPLALERLSIVLLRLARK